MFEQALRKKYRYESDRGFLTTEQLWDLPLEELDSIAQKLSRECEEKGSKSFIKKGTALSADLAHKLEVVVHIINVKMREIEEAEGAEIRRQKIRRIEEIIQSKKDEELQSKSLDELIEMVEELK